MIFNLFKSKPTLKELIPNGFVDIHSHIIPGIDDGAKNIKESIKLISKMKKLGFSKIIGTPHSYPGLYNNTNETIKTAYNELSKNITEEINIDYASEYMLDNNIIQKARKNELLCLKDNYVLVEMSYVGETINLFEIIYEIRVNDYKPILAHPERYNFFHGDLQAYRDLKNAGVLFQLNMFSLVNAYGPGAMMTARMLVDEEMYDFIGTDIHNQRQLAYLEKARRSRYLKKVLDSGRILNSKVFS